MDKAAVQERIDALRLLGTAQCLMGLYELGIEGCDQQEREQVVVVLQELIGAIDPEYPDIAEGFRRVYAYCLEAARQGVLDRVSFILTDLRDTLAQTMTGAPPAMA